MDFSTLDSKIAELEEAIDKAGIVLDFLRNNQPLTKDQTQRWMKTWDARQAAKGQLRMLRRMKADLQTYIQEDDED